MAFKLAEAFVEIGARMSPFKAGLRAAQATMQSFTGGMQSITSGLAGGMGLAMAGGMAGLGIAAGVAIKQMVSGASDLNETINKVGVIFGDQAKVVTSSADEMAAKFGIVKTTWMDGASEIGNLLQGMGGMGQKAAADMSVALSKAAADSSSIFNTSFGESLEKIKSAIRGQSEPISAFGVDVQEAAVAQEALRMGLVKSGQELTMQQKIAARTSLVLRGLKVAEGDLQNTSEGFANSSRALWGRIQNGLASMGQALMPIFEGMVHGLNKVAAGFSAWVENNKPQLAAFAAGVMQFGQEVQEMATTIAGGVLYAVDSFAQLFGYQSAFQALGDLWVWLRDMAVGVWEGIAAAIRNWGLVVEEVSLRAQQWIANIGEYFVWLETSAGTFLDWFGRNWVQVFTDAFNATLTALTNLQSNFRSFGFGLMEWFASGFTKPLEFVWTPLLDGFKATMEKLPDVAAPLLTDLSKEIDAVHEKMFQAENRRVEQKNADRAKAAGQAPAAAPGKREAAAMQSKPDKNKAHLEDIGGFVKRLQTAAFDKNVPKEQLDVAKQQLNVQKATQQDIRKALAKPAVAAGPA